MTDLVSNLFLQILSENGLFALLFVVLFVVFYLNQKKIIDDLKLEVSKQREIIMLQNSALAYLKGIVISNDRFDEKETNQFLDLTAEINEKVSKLYEERPELSIKEKIKKSL
jgi:hypothetical protein